MVAYNFKTQFAGLIVSGAKTQTIRAHRKRHARPGEAVQLYIGMRTRQCRKLVSPDPVCRAVTNLGIWVPTKYEPAHIILAGKRFYVTPEFARSDGFHGINNFTQFWFDTHGPGMFEGVLIEWEMPA